jgi:hypothetical protein
MKVKKRKKEKAGITTTFVLIFLFLAPAVFAQETTTAPGETVNATVQAIGGLSASTFYIMAVVIFLELFIILALLINVRFLLKIEKEKLSVELSPEEVRPPAVKLVESYQ